jgi:hypothetical protein
VLDTRQIRPYAAKQCAQLTCLALGEPSLLVLAEPSGQVVDVLDDRQGLGGERQDRGMGIIRVGRTYDEAGGLQPIQQAEALSRQRAPARERTRSGSSSPCRYGVLPLRCGFGSEGPQRRPRDQMTLKVEIVVDGGMHAQKALGRSG